MSSNASIVATLLREYGEAVRGGWSVMDGRMIRDDLAIMADALEVAVPPDIAMLRYVLELCPNGGGHWDNDLCTGDCSTP